jgi:hypothetical protein
MVLGLEDVDAQIILKIHDDEFARLSVIDEVVVKFLGDYIATTNSENVLFVEYAMEDGVELVVVKDEEVLTARRHQ